VQGRDNPLAINCASDAEKSAWGFRHSGELSQMPNGLLTTRSGDVAKGFRPLTGDKCRAGGYATPDARFNGRLYSTASSLLWNSRFVQEIDTVVKQCMTQTSCSGMV